MERCFNCNADIFGPASSCPSCGLPFVEPVIALHHRSIATERRATIWQGAFYVGLIVAFAAGTAVTRWAQEKRETLLTSVHQQEEVSNPENIPIEMVNDLFMRLMEDRVHLGFRSWYRTPQGAVVFEITPPTQNQASLWEVLNDEEKRQVMQYLGAAYTQVLYRMGHRINITENGHPPIGLKYYGHNEPLAARGPDGLVHIFPSPFARR